MSKENHATNKGITLTNICLEYTLEASHVFNFQQLIYYVSKCDKYITKTWTITEEHNT